MKCTIRLSLGHTRREAGVLSEGSDALVFQYSPEFVRTGLQLSPILVPLGTAPWRGNPEKMDGLPGFIHDAIPDGWGALLLDRRLRKNGKGLSRISPLKRLGLVGRDGMGALEFEPTQAPVPDWIGSGEIDPDRLARDAERILDDDDASDGLDELLRASGSAGGARPKIVCLVSDDRRTLRRGTDWSQSFTPWIVKFRGSGDARDAGVQEFISMKIARRAGLDVPPTHLFPSRNGPGWFGIRRFDRTPEGKVHMVSAAGLLHCSFRVPCLDYEGILALTQRLCGAEYLREMLRRAVLSFLVGNTDDHAKNFSFLMDASGKWRPSPVYDVVPAGGGGHRESLWHMTSLLGEGRMPSRSRVQKLGGMFGLKAADVTEDIDRVEAAMTAYPRLARDLGVRVPQSVTMRLPA